MYFRFAYIQVFLQHFSQTPKSMKNRICLDVTPYVQKYTKLYPRTSNILS
jgi:hypothetical protein